MRNQTYRYTNGDDEPEFVIGFSFVVSCRSANDQFAVAVMFRQRNDAQLVNPRVRPMAQRRPFATMDVCANLIDFRPLLERG